MINSQSYPTCLIFMAAANPSILWTNLKAYTVVSLKWSMPTEISSTTFLLLLTKISTIEDTFLMSVLFDGVSLGNTTQEAWKSVYMLGVKIKSSPNLIKKLLMNWIKTLLLSTKKLMVKSLLKTVNLFSKSKRLLQIPSFNWEKNLVKLIANITTFLNI